MSRSVRMGVVLAAAVAGLALAATPGTAYAATQLGQLPPSNPLLGCVAGVSSVQKTVAAGTSYQVPSGGGVITSWQHRGNNTTPGSGRLQVWTAAGGTDYTLVGRSDPQTFTAGAAPAYPTRVPVSGGQLLGLRTVSLDEGCEFGTGMGGDELNFSGGFSPDPAPNETQSLLNSQANTRINVAASLEPDADGDGFGDETQDLCPTSATTQGTCPLSPTPTGRRAAAIKKCKKKKSAKKRKKCKKKANLLPV